jgi:hypothetical protein
MLGRTLCTLPTACCFGVPRSSVPAGKSSNVPWTWCHALEPALIEPSSPGDACNVRWGRAGPSGAHMRGYPVRSLRIHRAVARVECQSLSSCVLVAWSPLTLPATAPRARGRSVRLLEAPSAGARCWSVGVIFMLPHSWRAPMMWNHKLTLCPAEAGRFLVLPAGATVHLAIPSRCPSVPKRSRVAPCHRRSRVPHGRHIHSHRGVRKRKAERHSSPG